MEVVREGGVEIRVPEATGPGSGEEVFYNPKQELNRDVTAAVLRAYREQRAGTSYLDAMTASGIRGIRAAAAGWDVMCVDVNPEAVALARANFKANDLTGAVRQRDANVELHRNRYDVVDIDPFGTPIPFIDSGIVGTRDVLCVTATDTAPLCGAHFRAGIRRYGAVPRNTEYHAEMGVRVLLSAIARTAARYDVAVSPLLVHATRHYVRAYLELNRRATDADAMIDGLGAVHHCESCLHRDTESGLIPHPPESCSACGESTVVTAGPIWLAPVRDPEFTSTVREYISPAWGTASQARQLLTVIERELDTATHYDQHRLCKQWNRPAGPMDEFLRELRQAGFDASRTHYGGTTFKTDASVGSIREATT